MFGSRRKRRQKTHLASAERAAPAAVEAVAQAVRANTIVCAVLDSFGGIVIVLNAQRQIVAMNTEFLRNLGFDDPGRVLGLRPGEALRCLHSQDNPEGGCGTSRFCRTCGAAVAIVGSQESGQSSEHECLLTVSRGQGEEALEFMARATPVTLDGQSLIVVSLLDIRDQKRREALETTFLHDFLKSALALRGAAQMVPRAETEKERCGLVETVVALAERHLMDIAERGELARVEAGEYETHFLPNRSSGILDLVKRLLVGLECARRKTLHIPEDSADVTLETDSVLLRRALTNLVKNALEATPNGGEVRIWCEAGGDDVSFNVWNAHDIPPNVAMRVFQRYFTTKEQRGRGLGTYTAKLIVERYLGGSISFSTSAEEGTVFSVQVPSRMWRRE